MVLESHRRCWHALVAIAPISYGPLDSSGNTCGWTSGQDFDARTAANIGSNGPSGRNDVYYTFDAAGRQTSASQNYYGTFTCGDTQCTVNGSGSFTRQYDAENHLLAQTYTGWETYGGSIACAPDRTVSAKNWGLASIGLRYLWGPNGHVIETGNTATGTMAYETLHWDGGSLLFTTNSAGMLDDIKIGGLANFVVSSGTVKVAFNDRDFSGAIASSHTSAGAGTWYPPNPNRQLCSSAGTSDPITQPGPDGITDGVNIFQGARAYDPVLGNWTAPDAYAGNVGDPMSQKAYMWDGNNSFLYEDPSGYCVEDACVSEGLGAGVAWLALGAVATLAAATHHEALAKGAAAVHSAIGHAVKLAFSKVGAWFRSRLPLHGSPGTTVVRPDDQQVRTYGPDGAPVRDIDRDHPHHHPGIGSPHAHDWGRDEKGNPVRGPARHLTPEEQQAQDPEQNDAD